MIHHVTRGEAGKEILWFREASVDYTFEETPDGMMFEYRWRHRPSGKDGSQRVWISGNHNQLFRLLNHWNTGGGDWAYWWP